MKKIIIIAPHFPPSNLTAVHRSRFFAQHLSEFGWEPIILTVHEKYYEEALDFNLEKLLPINLRIEKVKALKVPVPRIIGDVGLRGFFQLYKKGKQLIQQENIHFLYIPIPSFYCALLGRWLNWSTGIKYGIDYIDPWVHTFAGAERIFSRHWFATKISRLLEPVAVKNASLITGVAESYYKGVIERNLHLEKKALCCTIQSGGEKSDYYKVKILGLQPYLFNKNEGKIKLIHPGTMQPNAYGPLRYMFEAIKKNPDDFKSLEIYFIGSGKSADDEEGYNIKPLAEQYGLWQTVIFEHPRRIPYLDVLVHINASDGIFILGSVESHYTPSKAYQGMLSSKPIFAILNKESAAVQVLKNSATGMVLEFDGKNGLSNIEMLFPVLMKNFFEWILTFDKSKIDETFFDKYSAKNITKQLATVLDKIVTSSNRQVHLNDLNYTDRLKKVLIISPNFPPVNAADMHRVRQSLPYYKKFGWEPVIITVEESYIESYSTDLLLLHTIPDNIEIHKIKAFDVKKTRKLGLGSLSMRSYFQFKKKGDELLSKSHFDLVFFSTTAFHVMALGQRWKKKFGVPFILDFQDPWRRDFLLDKPKSQRPPKFLINWHIDKYVEAKAVPHANGIISVSKGYCDTFLERYPTMKKEQFKIIPFGAALSDIGIMEKYIKEVDSIQFSNYKKNIVYIGRGGHDLRFALEIIFMAFAKGLALNPELFSKVHFWFIGTSYAPIGTGKKTIETIARQFNVADHVTEVTDRIAYFETLFLLKKADILLVPGSMDKSYTASKIYPYIMLQKPLLAVFYEGSSVVDLLKNIHFGNLLTFNHTEYSVEKYCDECLLILANLLEKNNESISLDMEAFKPYTAQHKALEQIDFFNYIIS